MEEKYRIKIEELIHLTSRQNHTKNLPKSSEPEEIEETSQNCVKIRTLEPRFWMLGVLADFVEPKSNNVNDGDEDGDELRIRTEITSSSSSSSSSSSPSSSPSDIPLSTATSNTSAPSSLTSPTYSFSTKSHRIATVLCALREFDAVCFINPSYTLLSNRILGNLKDVDSGSNFNTYNNQAMNNRDTEEEKNEVENQGNTIIPHTSVSSNTFQYPIQTIENNSEHPLKNSSMNASPKLKQYNEIFSSSVSRLTIS